MGKEKKKIVTKIKDFLGYTTAHGFARLVESKNPVQRAFWVLACLGAFVAFGLQVHKLFSKFNRKPVDTYITVKHEMNLEFPAVTICNLNPIRKKHLPESLREYFKYSLGDSSTKEPTSKPTTSSLLGKAFSSVDSLLTKPALLSNKTLPSLVNSSLDTLGGALNDSLSSVNKLKDSGESLVNSTLGLVRGLLSRRRRGLLGDVLDVDGVLPEKEKDGGKPGLLGNLLDGVLPEKEKDGGKRKDGERPAPEELCESARRRKYLYWRIAETPTETLIQSGHQFLDMVQECSFAGVSCLGYNWTQFWNHLYGNCFVFNTAMIGSNRERNNISYTSSIPGPSDGLLLRLRIEGEEYLGNFSTVSGVRVHISDRHEMPFPGDKGFSVSPGFETSVGMRKVFIHREDPFGNNSCISDVGKPVVRPDYYMENFGVNYSTIACRSSCVANLQKTMCGCVESAYAITDELRKIVCNALNTTVFRCIVKANETAEDSDGKSCLTKCAIRCDENIYKLTISSAVFPSPSYQNISSQDLKSDSGNEEQIRANLLSLRIFFEEHNYETIEQRKSYELIDFLSDIGGQMGMFVGLSVLTCAELIELLALIIMHLFNRDHKRGAVGADTVTPVIELKKKPLVRLPRVE